MPLLFLKLVRQGSVYIIETWDGLWQACQSRMVLESPDLARELAAKAIALREVDLVWDLLEVTPACE